MQGKLPTPWCELSVGGLVEGQSIIYRVIHSTYVASIVFDIFDTFEKSWIAPNHKA